MMEPATAVLIERAHDPGGVGRMLGISLAAHAVVVALVALAPEGWRPAPQDQERLVMTISLGGAPGPRSGGLTPMGGRPIQQAIPLAEPPRPQPVRPPAAETPALTVPAPEARRRPAPAETPVRSAPREARGRTPTTGPETRAGSAVAETGGVGTGFGLSTGGGGTGGYLDVGNFCCPEYLSTMLQLIQRNWSSRQEVAGRTLMKFTIERDGTLARIELERTSGYAALDLTAQRALVLTRRLPPLPPAFPEDHLTVHLYFDYQR